MKDRFSPHPNNPNILVGKTYKLKTNPFKQWDKTHKMIQKLNSRPEGAPKTELQQENCEPTSRGGSFLKYSK